MNRCGSRIDRKEEPSVDEEIVEETVVEAPEDSNHDEEAED